MASIDVTSFPTHPKGNELDSIMERVSAITGERWTAAKVSGYWMFYKGGFGTAPVLQSKRKFDSALADATGLSVCRLVPMR